MSRVREQAVIDEHLTELCELTKWHREQEDLLAESEDHLLTRAEAFEGDSRLTWQDAQMEAVRAFGSAEKFARELAKSRWGELALPTPATRTAGMAALIAAPLQALTACFLVALALDAGFVEALFDLMLLILTLGLLGTAAGLIGLVVRTGLPAPVKIITAGTAGVWAVVSTIDWLTWSVISVLLSPAFATVILFSQRVTESRPWLAWATAIAWPVGAGVIALLYFLGYGAIDAWGMYDQAPWGWATAFLLLSIGGVAIGRQLRCEHPAPAQLLPDPSEPAPSPFYIPSGPRTRVGGHPGCTTSTSLVTLGR